MNSIQFNLARVIGPTLGGIALTTVGAAWCFGLNSLSFIAVIISLYMINVKYIPGEIERAHPGQHAPGHRLHPQETRHGRLIVLAFGMTLLGIPLLTFLPVFAKDVLHGGAKGFTQLLAFSGAGSVCGGLIVAAFGKIHGQGRTALMVLVLMGGIIFAFSQSTRFSLSLLLIFMSGGAMMVSMSMVSSLVQAVASDEMRGRVMSVYNVAFRGGMPVGSLILGKLIPIFSAPVIMGWSGGLLALLGLYFLVVQRRVAQL